MPGICWPSAFDAVYSAVICVYRSLTVGTAAAPNAVNAIAAGISVAAVSMTYSASMCRPDAAPMMAGSPMLVSAPPNSCTCPRRAPSTVAKPPARFVDADHSGRPAEMLSLNRPVAAAACAESPATLRSPASRPPSAVPAACTPESVIVMGTFSPFTGRFDRSTPPVNSGVSLSASRSAPLLPSPASCCSICPSFRFTSSMSEMPASLTLRFRSMSCCSICPWFMLMSSRSAMPCDCSLDFSADSSESTVCGLKPSRLLPFSAFFSASARARAEAKPGPVRSFALMSISTRLVMASLRLLPLPRARRGRAARSAASSAPSRLPLPLPTAGSGSGHTGRGSGH